MQIQRILENLLKIRIFVMVCILLLKRKELIHCYIYTLGFTKEKHIYIYNLKFFIGKSILCTFKSSKNLKIIVIELYALFSKHNK